VPAGLEIPVFVKYIVSGKQRFVCREYYLPFGENQGRIVEFLSFRILVYDG
jgi:hypothetical protein